jgi:hypothetical protein
MIMHIISAFICGLNKNSRVSGVLSYFLKTKKALFGGRFQTILPQDARQY